MIVVPEKESLAHIPTQPPSCEPEPASPQQQG